MDDRQTIEKLDEICGETRKASTLNALHACRPGHPWNKDAKVPFYNAWVMCIQNRDISGKSLAWLRKQAETRGEIAAFGKATAAA